MSTAIRPPVPIGLALALAVVGLRAPAAPHAPPPLVVAEPMVELPRMTATLPCTAGPYHWMHCTLDADRIACTTDYGPLGDADFVWTGTAFRDANTDCDPIVHTTRMHDGDTSCIENDTVSQRHQRLCAPEVTEMLCVSASRGVVGYRLAWPSPDAGEVRCGSVPASPTHEPTLLDAPEPVETAAPASLFVR